MAAKSKLDVVMNEDAEADLEAVVRAAELAGVDLTYAQTSGRNRFDGERVLSKSLAARFAFAMASGRVRPIGATRLRRAMSWLGMSGRDVAEAAGVSYGHVRAVLCGAVQLSPRGRLMAWVEEQETDERAS